MCQNSTVALDEMLHNETAHLRLPSLHITHISYGYIKDVPI